MKLFTIVVFLNNLAGPTNRLHASLKLVAFMLQFKPDFHDHTTCFQVSYEKVGLVKLTQERPFMTFKIFIVQFAMTCII